MDINSRHRLEHDGFLIVENWLSPAEVELLRADADALTRSCDALLRGCVFETTPESCCSTVKSFTKLRRPAASNASSLLFGAKLAQTAANLLGCPDAETPYLFNEQFIVKPAHAAAASAFVWHRDSQWLRSGARSPYVSLWCALDDVNEENGTIAVLPGTHLGASLEEASLPPATGDMCEEARIITAPAGTLVALSDTVLHCSGRNLSDAARRAWMPQVSLQPIADDGWLVRHAVPLPCS